MSDYTPGPWWFFKVSTFSDDFYLLEGKDSETGNDIDIASWRCLLDSDEESRAVADVIAAAPELLEACETFVEWVRREDKGFYDSEHSRDPETGLRYPEGSEEYRDAFWKWYDDNVDLCDLAKRQAEIAIDKAKGEEK